MYRLLALTSALALAGAAAAQPAPPPGDAAGPDQSVFISPAGEPFRDEPSKPYPVGAWFARADADKDGGLTLKEFGDDALRFFDVVDANKDGRIDGREVQAYEQEIAPEILPRVRPLAPIGEFRPGRPNDRPARGADGRVRTRAPGAGMPKGAAAYGLLGEPQPVTAPDTDFNGVITREEWSKAAQRRFSRLDVNADRAVRLDELPRTPSQAMQEAEAEKPKRRLF